MPLWSKINDGNPDFFTLAAFEAIEAVEGPMRGPVHCLSGYLTKRLKHNLLTTNTYLGANAPVFAIFF